MAAGPDDSVKLKVMEAKTVARPTAESLLHEWQQEAWGPGTHRLTGMATNLLIPVDHIVKG